jgi:hypothetical protein
MFANRYPERFFHQGRPDYGYSSMFRPRRRAKDQAVQFIEYLVIEVPCASEPTQLLFQIDGQWYPPPMPRDHDEHPQPEAQQRRDAVLKHMLGRPPMPIDHCVHRKRSAAQLRAARLRKPNRVLDPFQDRPP